MFVLGKRMEQLEMWIDLVAMFYICINLFLSQICVVNIDPDSCVVIVRCTFILSNNWHPILDV